MITSSSELRDRQPHIRIALLAAASLFAGAQALVPSSAGAMDDPPGCVSRDSMDWLFFNECPEGDGGGDGGGVPSAGEETIVIVDTKPDDPGAYKGPGRPPFGPGRSGSTGQDGGRSLGPGFHGAGSGSGAKPAPKKPAPKPKNPYPEWWQRQRWGEAAWMREQCITLYRKIQRFYNDERRISRGELGFWEWFFTLGPTTGHLNNYLRVWKRDDCSALYQTDVY